MFTKIGEKREIVFKKRREGDFRRREIEIRLALRRERDGFWKKCGKRVFRIRKRSEVGFRRGVTEIRLALRTERYGFRKKRGKSVVGFRKRSEVGFRGVKEIMLALGRELEENWRKCVWILEEK